MAAPIDIEVDARLVLEELKRARTETNRRVREGLKAAALEQALPRVQARAPSVVAPYLTARSRTRSAYITTRGPRQFDRITGLLNFGGVVHAPIRPRDKQALALPGGIVREAVTTPRRYRPKFFLERGIADALPHMEEAVRDHILRAFDGLPTEKT